MGNQIKQLIFHLMGFVLKNCESEVMESLNSTQSTVGSRLINDRLSLTREPSQNNFSQKNIFTSKQNYLYNDLLIACDYK